MTYKLLTENLGALCCVNFSLLSFCIAKCKYNTTTNTVMVNKIAVIAFHREKENQLFTAIKLISS
jgi:hypothetical protein